jgi:dihydrofolate reductase
MGKVSIVAALGRNRELGKNNQLLWHIPDDLKRFKQLTVGHAVIMGRKTFETIVAMIGKPLPGRTNIVVTRNSMWHHEGAVSVPSFGDGVISAWALGHTEQIFVCGGAQIYAEALLRADKLYLTLIDDEKEADTFFPPYEHLFTKKVFEEEREWEGLKYRFVDLEK